MRNALKLGFLLGAASIVFAGAAAQAASADELSSVTTAITSAGPVPDQSGIDRTFHPDYSQALTPGQMIVAWNAEIDRVFQTPISGGG